MFAGNAADIGIRVSSSSGGLATSLLVFALDAGIIDAALVTGMNQSSPLEPATFLARTREDILSSAGSKYCPVSANTALRELLANPGRYAVIGLPCHIHGICKAMEVYPELKERIVLIFGLVCNHTPSHHATEYLLRRNGISKEMVAEISYRGGGWPGVLSLQLRDGSRRTIPFGSKSYWGLIFHKFFFPPRCTLCIDKTAELSDASFMDAWLPRFSGDRSGTSLVIARTGSAISLIERAAQSGMVDIRIASKEDVQESQSIDYLQRRRAAMIRYLARKGRTVPEYHRPLPDVGAADRLSARMLRFRMWVSSRRRLWFAITLYERLRIQ
ncbi:MAG: Coenzyme F420 hydrogenase/dehydrogenase, beta subunit C-terminal domain [Candidatus Thermoplasmatota archaeon]